MKQKFLLSLVFSCMFIFSTRAQISKGAIWLGGNIGYNKGKMGVDTPYYKANNLNISPAVGIVVKDNLVVGIGLTYLRRKSENNGNILESKDNTYGVNVFARQYIPVVNRLYIFGEVGAGYSTFKGNETRLDYNYPYTQIKTTSKGWSSGLNVTPGLSFAITKKFHLETSLNSLLGVAYSKTETSPDKPNTGNRYKSDQFTAGLFTDGKVQFNIGCRFLLNNKG
jgi:outer membrane protein with beta-barrel domain